MKRFSLFFLLLSAMTLCVHAVNAPIGAFLPKLKFADERLQQLADMAEKEYYANYSAYTFEAEGSRWEGKSRQLMMLNYFLTVNSIINAPRVGEAARTDFMDTEAEQVQTAMFRKYLESGKLSEPKDIVARSVFTEKQVEALFGELDYLAEGPQYEMNQHASVSRILNKYIALRLEREIQEKLGESETLSFLSAEGLSFWNMFEALVESHGSYKIVVDGGGMYFSMLPLFVEGYAVDLLKYRIQSDKRVASLLGIAEFGVSSIPDNVRNGTVKDPYVASERYSEILRTTDIENEEVVSSAKKAHESAMQKYADFLQMRLELSDYIPQEKMYGYDTDTGGYRDLVAESCCGEGEEY